MLREMHFGRKEICSKQKHFNISTAKTEIRTETDTVYLSNAFKQNTIASVFLFASFQKSLLS